MEKPNSTAAFSLIEIILVISILAAGYYIAIPRFNLATGVEVSTKLGQLAADIRSAYDSSVLTGMPHRICFMLESGEYWLEKADRKEITLSDAKMEKDLTAEELEDEKVRFEDQFKEYEDLSGKEYNDPNSDEKFKSTSPLLEAKSSLEPPKWEKIENTEWGKRSIGPYMLFQDLQAEHHAIKQRLEDMGEDARAFIYFFPQGYVERAVIHVAFRVSGREIDTEKAGYTIITEPVEGTAEVNSGYMDLAEDNEKL